MNENTNWIWDKKDECGINRRVCFRRNFERPGTDKVSLDITADSRYELYVNGIHIGNGPVRYWENEYPYDTYDITRYLTDGGNVVAVMVWEMGMSSFQYLKNTPGLCLECSSDGTVLFESDSNFKCIQNAGYDSNSLPTSVQQSYAEVYDARKFDASWTRADFDDRTWENAAVVSKNSKLFPRDIPFLSTENLTPVRIMSHGLVKPVSAAIDLFIRRAVTTDMYNINPWVFKAYICLNVYAPVMQAGDLIFTGDGWFTPQGDVKVNGRFYPHSDGDQMNDGLHIKVQLDRGDNLVVIRLDGKRAGFVSRMCFDFAEKVEFADIADYAAKAVVLGAFYAEEVIGDIPCGEPEICVDDSIFERAFISDVRELKDMQEYVVPLNESEICVNTVYGMSTVNTLVKRLPVTPLSNAMIFDSPDSTVLKPAPEGEHSIIVDFGKEVTGFIGFDIDAPAGIVFDFYMFEYMSEKGLIQHTSDLDNTLRYISRGGEQHYDSVLRRGFRYMMITIRNHTKEVSIHKIYANMNTYPVADIGRFLSDDHKLNKIWEISAYTTKLCMEDTFVDCPAYEQTFWVGDSRNEALICYYAYGAYEMVRHCLDLVWKSEKQSPLLNDQVPSGWLSIIPNWAFLYVMACREYYDNTGDMEFIDRNLLNIAGPLKAYSEKINEQGLLYCVGFNLFDWAPMDMPFSGIIASENALYVRALRAVEYLAEKTENAGLAEWCRQTADRVSEAVAIHLWNEKKQAFVDCIHDDELQSEVVSQQTNLLVYMADCYRPEQKAALEKILTEENEGIVNICTPFAAFFYLEALAKLKKYQMITDYIAKWWGIMLADDASCTWEMFVRDSGDFPTRSRCHAWSAAPAYFLSAYALGVRVNAVENTITISPKPCGLKRVSGAVPLMEGRVLVEWRIVDDEMQIYVEAPEKYTILYDIDREGFRVKKIVKQEV